ncbi:helix-turn-helix domain-containing protein [Kitasatospora sp. CB01950]|uniref:helix-turn-helix domain-containing protein n=1 Tax=Kitasatospora sp. CB01950 TaxID=1703930 RepID=UPI00093C45A8|nr:MerR family transcriptional regulator [Kitasatospora sp. CB01950]OKJ06672.1 MerR family transcriptional regulator [Kitasatospora sp. CB01950]
MDGEELVTIGELARRTGLTVKTVRYWSDTGLVPSTDRTPAGYRRYRTQAVARLELVRTLRELGIGLATIRQVLERESTVAEVARAHADALDAQIRTLRLRRAVLRTVAEQGSETEEIALMHRLARLSSQERRRMIEEFVEDTFGTADANPELVAMLRTAVPELPEEPTPAQVAAWVELAELTQDAAFRASLRRMAAYQAAERAAGDTTGLHHELTEHVREAVTGALAAGLAPDAPQAAAVVADLTARYAQVFDRPDDAALRTWLLARLDVAADPRVERYWHLLSRVNDWPEPPSLTPVFDWFGAALREVARRPTGS